MSALTCVGRISAIRAVHFAGAIGMGMSTRCCVGEEGEEAGEATVLEKTQDTPNPPPKKVIFVKRKTLKKQPSPPS